MAGRHGKVDRSDLNRVKGIDLKLDEIDKVGGKGIGIGASRTRPRAMS